jgi:hypothetical protein
MTGSFPRVALSCALFGTHSLTHDQRIGAGHIMTVGVEKLEISENRDKFGDRKCLGDLCESYVRHPDAIYFSADSWGVSFSTATTVITS